MQLPVNINTQLALLRCTMLPSRWIDFAMVPSLPGEESFGSVWGHSFP